MHARALKRLIAELIKFVEYSAGNLFEPEVIFIAGSEIIAVFPPRLQASFSVSFSATDNVGISIFYNHFIKSSVLGIPMKLPY